MEKTAYSRYAAAVEAHKQRISELNNEINVNRGKYEEALAKRDMAVLEANPEAAEAQKARCEELDDTFKWLQRDLQLISGKGVSNNPVVVKAAKAVMDENAEAMKTLQARWDHMSEQLGKHKGAFMQLVCELGKVERDALKLRAQLNDITDTTGLRGTWLSTPGARAVNLLKNEGIIFMPERELAERFKFPDKFDREGQST